MLGIRKLMSISKKIKLSINLYRKVLRDKRTPLFPKILLIAAIGYLLMPFDIIPDFIPFIGQLDDAIIVPALIYIALKLIPKELKEEYKLSLS